MHRTMVNLIIFVTIVVCIWGCGKKETNQVVVEEPEVEEIKEVESVCIWDKGSLRAEPSRKAKWVSQMALGERVIWTGEIKVDSTDKDRQYYRLKLSDGTEGWASEYVVVTNAKPGVLVKKTSIYNRPDLVTESDTKFKEMDIVAVESAKDDWLKVIGAERKKSGWIPSLSVSTSGANVAVALLFSKAMNEKTDEEKIEKLEDIVNNNSFSGSVFIQNLTEKIKILKPLDEMSAGADSL